MKISSVLLNPSDEVIKVVLLTVVALIVAVAAIVCAVAIRAEILHGL